MGTQISHGTCRFGLFGCSLDTVSTTSMHEMNVLESLSFLIYFDVKDRSVAVVRRKRGRTRESVDLAFTLGLRFLNPKAQIDGLNKSFMCLKTSFLTWWQAATSSASTCLLR